MGFFQSDHGFGLKIKNFPPLCFWENRKGKCVWRYPRKKKCVSRKKQKTLFKTIETREWTKKKLGNFSRGLVHGFGQKVENFWKICLVQRFGQKIKNFASFSF